MKCPKCAHEWDYKGKSKLYLTCPNCYRKIRAETPTEEKQLTTTQSISLEEVEAARDEYVRKYFEEQPGQICWSCIWDWQECFTCENCHAQFHTDRADARFCPACGSRDLIDYLDQGDSPVVKRLREHDTKVYGVHFENSNSPEHLKAWIAKQQKELDQAKARLARAEKK